MESRGEMMTPYKCPICEGIGKVTGGFYDGNPNPVCAREDCRTCSGTGILWGFSYKPTPNYTPWINPDDGNTTLPPFEIIYGSDNISPNDDEYMMNNMRGNVI